MKWDLMSLSNALEKKLRLWMSDYWAYVLSFAIFPFVFYALMIILQAFTPRIIGHFGCGLILCYFIISMVYYEYRRR